MTFFFFEKDNEMERINPDNCLAQNAHLIKLKAKLSKWESSFESKKGRKPTLADIQKIEQVGKEALDLLLFCAFLFNVK